MATPYSGRDDTSSADPGRDATAGDLGSPQRPPTHDERARVGEILDDAVAGGRITSTEREQRLESAGTATTVGQLTALTSDLGTDERGAGTVNEDL